VAIARQLSHGSLPDLYRVFCNMDTNGDGVLSIDEVREGFAAIFSEGPSGRVDYDALFEKLDVDGSGQVDYTEFCAAGIGVHIKEQDESLRAAFRLFDINDDDMISPEEIRQVLTSTDLGQSWSPALVDRAVAELLESFDEDHDGLISFEEWRRFMEAKYTEAKCPLTPRSRAESQTGWTRAQSNAYSYLARLNGGTPTTPPSPRLQAHRDNLAVDLAGEPEGVPVSSPQPKPFERPMQPPPRKKGGWGRTCCQLSHEQDEVDTACSVM